MVHGDEDEDVNYEDTSYEEYDDGAGPDANANYSPEAWNPTETSALLVAGRKIGARYCDDISIGDVKSAVTTVETFGDGMTLVMEGDTTSSGPADDTVNFCGLAVGVIVARAYANDEGPTGIDKASVLEALACAKNVDHAAVAQLLPEALREEYLEASDELLLVPVGPLPRGVLLYGIEGKESESHQGTFWQGSNTDSEPHFTGVWGEVVKDADGGGVCPVEFTKDDTGTNKYWLLALYD